MPQVKQRATQRLPFFRGSYPLLYFAILVIMVVVSLTRYHLLIKDIVAEATEDRALQLELLGAYVPDKLLRKSLVAHGTEIQDSLDEELDRHRGVQSLQWEFDGRSYTSDRPGTASAQVPRWFAELATLAPLQQEFEALSPQGSKARLTVRMRGDTTLHKSWVTVMRQIPVSLLIIVTVFTLLSLLLRVNSRLL